MHDKTSQFAAAFHAQCRQHLQASRCRRRRNADTNCTGLLHRTGGFKRLPHRRRRNEPCACELYRKRKPRYRRRHQITQRIRSKSCRRKIRHSASQRSDSARRILVFKKRQEGDSYCLLNKRIVLIQDFND